MRIAASSLVAATAFWTMACAGSGEVRPADTSAADTLAGQEQQRMQAAVAMYRAETATFLAAAQDHRITFGEFAGATEHEAGLVGTAFFASPCATLRHLGGALQRSARLGFFTSVEIQGSGIGDDVSVGADLVWDFYHNEVTTTTFRTNGLSVPPLSISGTAAAGLAWNFNGGVEDWYGRFYDASVGVSLPNDLFGVSLSGFVSGYVDRPGINPMGVVGVAASLSIGISAVPMPVSAAVSDGLWTPNANGIAWLARHLDDMPGVSASLRDQNDGECSQAESRRGDCIVQLDGSVSQSIALCHSLSSSCFFGPALVLVQTPLALRALLRAGGNLEAFCPNNA